MSERVEKIILEMNVRECHDCDNSEEDGDEKK